jgi:CRISPR-associated protein Csd1
MILQALAHLAAREELIDDPSYEPAAVAYFVHLDRGGRYLTYTAPRMEGTTKGKKTLFYVPKRPVPRRSESRVGIKPPAEFLVDNPTFVFGVDPREKFSADVLAGRRQRFRQFISKANEAVAIESLNAVLAFLDGPMPSGLHSLLTPASEAEKKECAAALFAFIYEPDGGVDCVHDDSRVRSWFRNHLADDPLTTYGQCLVTGAENVALTKLHGKPKGIPPKSLTKGGVPLTSTNAAAFKSYGLEDIGCAPISRSANVAVETALNRLLDPAYKAPSGEICLPRSLAINPQTAFLFWSREDAGLDWLSQMNASTPEDVAALLRSPYKSGHVPLDDPSEFYGLVLSGMQGRAMVRSFLQSTVRDVAAAVDHYRDEVGIAKPYGQPAGSFSLFEYRRALAPLRDVERLPAALGTELYMAIIFGRPFPRAILQAVVSRNRVELLPRREKSDGRDEMLLAARCSLLKAYLIRNQKETYTVALDRTRTDPPYRLGRLLAIVDRLQADALGTVNATIVDRYYGSASSTPSAVFPTLLRRSQHHLGKLRREKTGLAIVTEKLLHEVVSDLSAFPRTMNLEQQGAFALGFYHQRQDFFAPNKGENQA